MNTINSSNDKGMNAILKGVGLLIDEKSKNSSFDRTLSGLITQTNYETNTYTVKINGYEYRDVNSMIKANINDSVLIMCPQNQLSQMFIYGKIDNTDYSTLDIYKTNTTIMVQDTIKGIIKNSAVVSLKLEAGCMYMLYGISYNISTGAIVNNSVHSVYTSLITADTLATPTKLHGTTNLPFTVGTASNQTLTLTNLGSSYESHFTLQKIF